jgi:hypothetical protein
MTMMIAAICANLVLLALNIFDGIKGKTVEEDIKDILNADSQGSSMVEEWIDIDVSDFDVPAVKQYAVSTPRRVVGGIRFLEPSQLDMTITKLNNTIVAIEDSFVVFAGDIECCL